VKHDVEKPQSKLDLFALNILAYFGGRFFNVIDWLTRGCLADRKRPWHNPPE